MVHQGDRNGGEIVYELIRLLEYLDLSPYDIIELLNDILDSYNSNKEILDNYAIDNYICPKCMDALKKHTWKEDRGECRGTPTYEIMTEIRCDNCNIVF